jgi:hypothetical protein
MQSLEKRIAELEALASLKNKDLIRVVYCEDGETGEQARERSGVPCDFGGKVIAVQFIDSLRKPENTTEASQG